MNMKSWHWAVAISALTFGFAACTVTSGDGDSDGGTGGSSAAGSGGSAQGGSATGGSATGGSATGGSATGGSAQGGASGDPCKGLASDSCSQCVGTKCCTEYTACVNDPDKFCEKAMDCMNTCDKDAATCAKECDDGHMNVPWNNLFNCMSTKCLADCSASGGSAGAGGSSQ